MGFSRLFCPRKVEKRAFFGHFTVFFRGFYGFFPSRRGCLGIIAVFLGIFTAFLPKKSKKRVIFGSFLGKKAVFSPPKKVDFQEKAVFFVFFTAFLPKNAQILASSHTKMAEIPSFPVIFAFKNRFLAVVHT